MSAGQHRMVEVPPERLVRWADGFAERHGTVQVEVGDTSIMLAAADGALAELEIPWPPMPAASTEPPNLSHTSTESSRTSPVIMQFSPLDDGRQAEVAALAEHAALPRTALLVLVRRGGYGAGLARDGVLLAHAVGTRYVQGRTAAGGTSQQRFARRRSGQAAALAGSAGDAVHKVVSAAAAEPEVLVVAGDRSLVEEVLGAPRLAHLTKLPRSPLLPVPDPRLIVLKQVAKRARSVRVRITDPA